MTTAQRYVEMADQLESELAVVPVGSRVPSEHALAARFVVSRPTARAALQELERRLLVRRVQGLGTFRRGRISYVVSAGSAPSFTETVRRAGAEAAVRLLSCHARPAVAQECRSLEVDVGATVWVLERLYSVNGELAGYATSVLPHRSLPGLDRALTTDASLAATLDRRYGLRLSRCRYRLGFALPPQAVADRLCDGERGPIWLAESTNRVAGGPRVEYSRTYLRPDVLDVVFEIEEGTDD